MFQVKKFFNRYISWITFALIIVMWQLFGWLELLPKYVLPTPLEIVNSYSRDYDLLLHHAKETILVGLLGLMIGVILACILALIMDSFSLFNKAIYPILVVIQTIPTIALAPILVLWLGYGTLPKVTLITMTTTFPVVVNILDGFRQTDKDTLMLFQLMKASKWQILKHLKIPFALPYFFSGLKVSVSYAFIASVVSEWLGGFDGLGVYIIRAKKLFQYDTMFAIIILVSLLSLCGMACVHIIEKKVIKWKN